MTIYYVATNGGDTAAGTEAAPFRTLGRAREATSVGDSVVVKAGTYVLPGPIKPKTDTSWYSEVVEGARLDCSNVTKAFSMERTGATGVLIDGFEIFNSQGAGIGAVETDGCIFKRNHIHDCVDNGISYNHSDLGIIDGNHVHHCATMGSRSGISVLMSKTRSGTALSGGYGIRITNNTCHHNGRPDSSGRSDTDGNGIILDKLHYQSPMYTRKVLVEGNICYLNSGSGFRAMASKDIWFRFNTAWGNKTNDNGTGTWGGEFQNQWASGNTFEYNIGVSTNSRSAAFENVGNGNTYEYHKPYAGNTWVGNIFYAEAGRVLQAEGDAEQLPTSPSGYTNVSPRFVASSITTDPYTFALASDSPARGTAPGGKNIGAWQGGTPPVEPGDPDVTVTTAPRIAAAGTESGSSFTYTPGTYTGTPTISAVRAQLRVDGIWQALDPAATSNLTRLPVVTAATQFRVKEDYTGQGVTGTAVNPSNIITVVPESVDPGDPDPDAVWVSSSGSDTTGDGTFATPYATITKGITEVAVNGEVTVKPGTYTEAVHITKALTLRSEVTRGAKVIGPNGAYGVISIEANNVSVIGFEVQGAAPTGNHGIVAEGRHHVTIVGNWVHHCRNNGISFAYGDFCTIEDNELGPGNAWVSWDSGISVYQLRNVSGNADPAASGSVAGFRNVIRGNVCHDNVTLAFINYDGGSQEIRIGDLVTSSGGAVRTTPVYVEGSFKSAQIDSSMSIPATYAAGTTVVAMNQVTAGTAPTPPAPWEIVAQINGSTVGDTCSTTIAKRTATGTTGLTWGTWTNSPGGNKCTWQFNNAEVGVSAVRSSLVARSIDWPALPAMTAGSLVVYALYSNLAFDPFSFPPSTAFVERNNRTTPSTGIGSGTSGDTGTTLLDAYAGATVGSLPTAAQRTYGLVEIRGVATGSDGTVKSGTVAYIDVQSGSWAGGNAAGQIGFLGISEDLFSDNDVLTVNGVASAVAASAVYTADHTDGNGIIIDDGWNSQNGSTAGPYIFKTLVEGNVCYANGGKGIQVVWSDHVTVRHNTAWNNNRDLANLGTWRGEINVADSSYVDVADNIAVSSDPLTENDRALGFGAVSVQERVGDGAMADTGPTGTLSGATKAITGGKLRVTNSGAAAGYFRVDLKGLTIGRSYDFSGAVTAGTAPGGFRIVDPAGPTTVWTSATGTGTRTTTITPTVSQLVLDFLVGSSTSGQNADFDNVSFHPTVKQVGVTVRGTITFNGTAGETSVAVNEGGAYTDGGGNKFGVDPKLVDPAHGDFTLASDSPAIGAATDGTNIGHYQTTVDPDITITERVERLEVQVNDLKGRVTDAETALGGLADGGLYDLGEQVDDINNRLTELGDADLVTRVEALEAGGGGGSSGPDRKINITDIIGPINAASEAQKQALRTALGLD